MKRIVSFLPTILFTIGAAMVLTGQPAGLLLLLFGAVLCAHGMAPRLYVGFPSNCQGRIINVPGSAGCTLTRASVQALTPNNFAALNMTEIGMDQVYARANEARVAGYRENNLMMLINSRITNIKSSLARQNISPSESVILPYISRRQKRNIQSNYWSVTAGAPNTQAGTGDIHPGAWDLTITNNPSPYANTLQNLDQYFLPGKTLFVEYSSASNVAYNIAYTIIASATVGGVCKVTVAPNSTANGWLGMSAAQKLPYQIGGSAGGNAQAGTLAYLGVNSVSDFESWKGQDVAENTNSLLNFFLQTSRIVFEYTDEYMRSLNDALLSNYFKMFASLPLSEQRRIHQAKYDRDMINSVFYGQPINELQTVETYQQLPSVVDPANPNCVLEYKSNALGFMTQLANCNRNLDHQGNPLNLDMLCQALYLLKRAREADGTEVDTIDIMTDRWTAGMIEDLFIAYYKKKYGVVTQRTYRPGEALKFENQVVWNYNVYQLPIEYGGFNLAVFTHQTFDDKLSAMAGAVAGNAAAANAGRVIWAIDWTDFQLGIAGTNSRMTETNPDDELYRYVIKLNTKHVSLNSTTWCPIIEDPNRHWVVKNFGPQCPTLTVSGCNLPA